MFITVAALLIPLLSAAFAAGPSTSAASDDGKGRILCAYWREVPGTRIEDLTSLKAYPDQPNEQLYLDRFAIAEDQEGNFGTLIRGYVHPPQDGSYTFYISGNNQCELWLSSDASQETKRRIALVPQWSMPQEWTTSPEQQSAPIQFKHGAAYYIEARHKNGGGDNHLAVAWKLPDGTFQGPIPGQFLSPAIPVVVPPPVVAIPSVPASSGQHRITAQVEYLTQQIPVPVLITLPTGYSVTGKCPAVVFLPDTDQEPEADGFYVQGPNKPSSAHPSLSQLHFIGISPQPAAGRSYTQRTTVKAMAAVVAEICSRYPIDKRRIGLTGEASGGTALWQLAMEMPGFYSALAPVNGREVHDPQLADALRGADIRIYTDIAEGFATGCANRMAEDLATLQPKPQVVYLGEKELGKGSAGEYCYQEPSFYAHLLRVDLIQSQPSGANTAISRLAVMVPLLVAGVVAGLYFYVRRRSRAA